MSKHLSPSIRVPIDSENPSILRDEEKCIKCGACCRVCHDEIAVGEYYDLASCRDLPICVGCGQCANVCPTDSITERPEWGEVWSAIQDPDKIVVVSTSPSVRVALGEEFGMEPGSYVEGKMVAALRALGFDYVLDTTFAADLTIMEEASELVERVTQKSRPLPQFTSCCPAWVKFVETFYPDFIPNLSTAKSPIGMQGPTVKTYFAKQRSLDPTKIVHVALTPCTAKKFEVRRREMCAAALQDGRTPVPDTDHIITTRELAAWLKAARVDFTALQESEYDSLLGRGSGAGIIFGNTGGVMEAAVRTAWYFVTGETPPKDLYHLSPVRGMEGVKSATLEIGGVPVRIAIAHGLANAKALLEQIKMGEAPFDFIEVMTCRGGCIGGGGQPKDREGKGDALRAARIAGLYSKDDAMAVRCSYENPDIIAVYREFYGKPLSPLAESILHTIYFDRHEDLGAAGMLEATVPPTSELSATSGSGTRVFRCKICNETIETGSEGLPADFQCPICGVGADQFEEITPKAKRRFRCKICGDITETGPEGLPEDFICPICGVPASQFEEI